LIGLLKIIRFYRIEINVGKAKLLRISSQPSPVQIITDQKQLENAEYFKYLRSMVTHDARCTREIKAILAMAKAAFHEIKTIFTSKLDFNLRKKPVKYYVWNIGLYGTGTWTLLKVGQKYLESFET
jgi:hypothetical protein